MAIPGTVTNLGRSAFDGCSSLGDVSIAEGVPSIGERAFSGCGSLADVVLPDSVKDIGAWAFYGCNNLSSVSIGLNVTNIGAYAFFNCRSLVRVVIPDSVITIGQTAFRNCWSLESITLGEGVVGILDGVFLACTNLSTVFFTGNAPSLGGASVFDGGDNATVYYLPGRVGWGETFGGRPAVLWNPEILTRDASFGVGAVGFGFKITGTPDIPIVIQACTDLMAADWLPLRTDTLEGGSVYFSDTVWSNHPTRFYTIRWP